MEAPDGINPEFLTDPTPDMELAAKEAAAYLGVSARVMHGLKANSRGPVVEKRGHLLMYRKSSLDAFLRENGPDPLDWIAGWSRDAVECLRAVGVDHPGLEQSLKELDAGGNGPDWDPDQAR
jgi:hypothetical protein